MSRVTATHVWRVAAAVAAHRSLRPWHLPILRPSPRQSSGLHHQPPNRRRQESEEAPSPPLLSTLLPSIPESLGVTVDIGKGEGGGPATRSDHVRAWKNLILTGGGESV